jgi:hypothetical protein
LTVISCFFSGKYLDVTSIRPSSLLSKSLSIQSFTSVCHSTLCSPGIDGVVGLPTERTLNLSLFAASCWLLVCFTIRP